MPIFGQYESGGRRHLSGVGAIYALKSDDKKIIKVLQPPEGIWTDEQLGAEIDGFLSRANTQKTLAGTSENWAPVHDSAAIREGTEGSSGGGAAASQAEGADYRASGAYLIMDRYERTVQSLLDGRVNLNNNDLRTVMSGILKGLRDIRKIAHRPNGSLKPANILLANSTDLAQATVHLSDPAAESSLTAASDKKDFSDLAKILYELVNLRPYQGGVISRTKDWDELGPNGGDWRKFCNTLLEVGGGGGSAEDRDFDKMLATIDTWRAKPRKSKIPLLAAGVLVLVIVAGVAGYMLTRPPKLDFNQANWEKLCLEYHAWFENFAGMDDGTRKKYASAPYPTEVVKLLDAAGRDLDRYQPQNIAKKPQSYINLAMAPTDDAKTGYGPYYTKQGVELIDKVSAALTPVHWQLLTTLDKTAATYEQRGWVKPAAGIRSLIESAKPPAIPTAPADIEERAKVVPKTDMFAHIENTIKASAAVTDIEAKWARIQDKIKALPASNIPVLQAFTKFAEDVPRSGSAGAVNEGTLADVTALAASFVQIDQALDKLAALKDPPFDLLELGKDPAAKYAEGDKVTVEKYAGLLALADRDYKRLVPDPRPAVTNPKLLEEFETDIDIIAKANRDDAHLGDLNGRRDALTKQIAGLKGFAAISKNAPEIKSQVDAVTRSTLSLTSDSSTWSAPYKIKPDEYIAKQKVRIAAGLHAYTPAVETQWRTAGDNLLKKISAAPQELKNYKKFMEVEGKFKSLDAIYADFDNKMIPSSVPGLSDFPGKEGWKSAIASRVVTVYREQALTDLMTNPALRWADDLPQVTDPAYQSYARQRIAGFGQTRTDTLALMDDFSTIQTRLDHLDLRAGEPAKDAKTWRELITQWKDSKNALLADGEIAAALKPITDRTAALLALDNVNDYKSLSGSALSPAAEVSLAAWRKIGEASITENLPVLDDEEKNQAHLGALFTSLAKAGTLDPPGLSALTTEVSAQRPLRWHRYAGALTSAAAIQSALDRRAAFGVTLSAQTDANLVYDDHLYQFRKQFEKNPKEAELKDFARKFIASVQSMPASVSQDKGIQELIVRLEKPLAPGAGEVSTAGAGPKLAGWEQENPSPEVRIFYLPSKAAARQTLEFTRIQAAQKTVFLCTTEVSFAIFAQAAAAHFADLDNTGKPAAQAHWFKVAADPWDGPRVWKISERQFALNDEWVFKSPQLGNNSPYPPNGVPEKPAAAHPMQQLSPWSALYVARLLGCRLPTSEEWKAAYDKFEASSNGPKDAWNLRGNGWLGQQQYALKMSTKGAQFPDQGIFLSADQLFGGITADAAIPWQGAALAKLAPNRITAGGVYGGSQLWFRKVGAQPGVGAPGAGTGLVHDLVGNVGEYVFDAPNANAVIKDALSSVENVNAALSAGSKNLFVLGGSSLSPPQIPCTEKQPVDLDFAQTATGFSDVGFRLAYTAPIDSIADVLAAVFKDPQYLPGSKAR